MSRLRDKYRQEVVPALLRERGYQNVMQAPRLEKVVVNVGLGEATQNARAIDAASQDIGAITGQRPIVTRSKRSIAAFRIRKGMPIGLKVTLRGERMYEFLDRLMNAALPRIRDFRGISPEAFDGRGGFSIGLKEQIVFPEIEFDKVDKVRGLQVNISTSARTDEEARQLLQRLGMPFAKAS